MEGRRARLFHTLNFYLFESSWWRSFETFRVARWGAGRCRTPGNAVVFETHTNFSSASLRAATRHRCAEPSESSAADEISQEPASLRRGIRLGFARLCRESSEFESTQFQCYRNALFAFGARTKKTRWPSTSNPGRSLLELSSPASGRSPLRPRGRSRVPGIRPVAAVQVSECPRTGGGASHASLRAPASTMHLPDIDRNRFHNCATQLTATDSSSVG